MRAVVQRVTSAQVIVNDRIVGEIAHGLLVLACAMAGDTDDDVAFISRKIGSLRIFADEQGKMNLNVRDAGGDVLLISQFTLSADTTSGTRPSFSSAMAPDQASKLIDELAVRLRQQSLNVAGGEFGAYMRVELVNDGPVTIYLDSKAKRRK